MSDIQQKAKRIGEIERKISDGEALLQRANRANQGAWVFIFLGLLITIFSGGIFKVIGLLLIAVFIWRIAKVWEQRNEIEGGLSEYRGEKAELHAMLIENK